MRSLTLSQWRDLRIGVICEDLGALTTARASEFRRYDVFDTRGRGRYGRGRVDADEDECGQEGRDPRSRTNLF